MNIIEITTELKDFFIAVLEQIAPYILIFIDFALTCLELRILVSWFLNINPFFFPFYPLWIFTDPFMWGGKGLWPRIFGMDITSMINFRMIAFIRQKLEYFVFYQQSHKMGIDENDLALNSLNEFFQNNFLIHYDNMLSSVLQNI
jgi:hypothetical protein